MRRGDVVKHAPVQMLLSSPGECPCTARFARLMAKTVITSGAQMIDLPLDSGEHAARNGEEQRDQSFVISDHIGEFRGAIRGRPRSGRQHVVEDGDAARAEQAQPGAQVFRVSGLIGIAENEIVPSVGQSRQDVARAAEDQPCLIGGEARVPERLAGQTVVLGLDVHAGEHTAGAHAAQQPDAGTAAAGTDLHDRARRYRGREEPQHGTCGRLYGHGPAEVRGVGSGGEQRFILNRVRRLVIVDNCPLERRLSRVSLANFAGPWNLKAVLSVGQVTSEALFQVA